MVLYFSEGAGCQSCIVQMRELEKKASELAEANITVLPIVMNTRDQIVRDMGLNVGVITPFLLDDGTVSQAYGTLGNGMHAGLPGHSFVLIDTEGQQRWYGEYPSMSARPRRTPQRDPRPPGRLATDQTSCLRSTATSRGLCP